MRLILTVANTDWLFTKSDVCRGGFHCHAAGKLQVFGRDQPDLVSQTHSGRVVCLGPGERRQRCANVPTLEEGRHLLSHMILRQATRGHGANHQDPTVVVCDVEYLIFVEPIRLDELAGRTIAGL